MAEFAESEIVIPTGPYAGLRLELDRNPWARLWFNAIDSGMWRRHFMTGSAQGGKTLAGSVVPVLYHLFELRETVVYAVPTLDMVADKWEEDLLPAIEASRYREFLPKSGRGARGGVGTKITFGNGATLRFMTGGGQDKSRAGFTTRVVVVTETDGFDTVGQTSKEASKFAQIEARTRAFLGVSRLYAECTVSTEEGRTWSEIQGGSASAIALRCPHCRGLVTPERKHLVGWAEAQSALDASDRSRLVCPSCGVAWSEDDRRQANLDALLVHKGQTIERDVVSGQAARTDTLGFRWNAANNLLVPINEVGAEEWRASKEPDEDLAERKMLQFTWALPPKSAVVDLTQLEAASVAKRTVNQMVRGIHPPDTERITLGADIGQRLTHWTIVASRTDGSRHVIDYGRVENPSDDIGVERGVLFGLRTLRDTIARRMYGPHRIGLCVIDEGFQTPVVHSFIRESGVGFISSKGVGATMYARRQWERDTGAKVVSTDGTSINVILTVAGVTYLELDADAWKTRVHDSLVMPLGTPGCMTLFGSDDPNEHTSFGKHLTAERKTQEFVPNRGQMIRWIPRHENNHWLDATSLAFAAARLLELTFAPQHAPESTQPTAPTTTRRVSEYGRTWL